MMGVCILDIFHIQIEVDFLIGYITMLFSLVHIFQI